MPKNATQRLQKIENDIKTVISIYDVTKKVGKGDEKTRKEIDSSRLSKVNLGSKFSDNPNMDTDRKDSSQTTTFSESLKKFGTFTQRPSRDVPPENASNHGILKKPGSPPFFPYSPPKVNEQRYIWQLSTDHNNGSKIKWEKGVGQKIDNLNSAECIQVPQIFMSPSKTLETANEILAKNNFNTHDRSKVPSCIDDYSKTEEGSDSMDNNSALSFDKLIQKKQKTFQKELHETLTSKSFSFPKSWNDPKKDKSTSEISTNRHVIPKKIQRMERQRPKSPENKHKMLEEKDIKNWRCIDDTQEGVKKIALRHFEHGEIEGSKSSQLKFGENFRDKREENADGGKTKESHQLDQKIYNFKKESKSFTNVQETSKPEVDESELGANELFKIIERSNEKLEKMKISKELALDIAKQLKDKYDEIQHSKQEMVEKLQNVEKDNERLNNEIKDANELKKKLQLKMEEFRMDSRTILLERDTRAKEIMEENIWLRTKLSEEEKKHAEDLLEKDRQIERIKRERLFENKHEVKTREDISEHVQRLVAEKSELLAKIGELRFLLNSRHSKEERLEERISELQGEILTHKEHLRQKTERLEDTNKELEIIRQNSKDLEEQVKLLRTNIEKFDQLHQNLVKQSNDYENQLKSNEEEIKTLQEENAKLKKDLEDEKDSLLIKNKIIEDQQETIKQMREKTEEVKTLTKRNQSLERILNMEREEKLELQEAVERLKQRKEELKKKVKTLENDLLLAPQEVVRDLQKTQIVLHELENQVQVKQKEWELHLQSLIKEKEQACNVAEFATKKLMQTTNEFQKQSEAQKRLHRALAENLAEKEKHLREVTEKVGWNNL